VHGSLDDRLLVDKGFQGLPEVLLLENRADLRIVAVEREVVDSEAVPAIQRVVVFQRVVSNLLIIRFGRRVLRR
jgi:hypothetical protein